MAAFTPPSPERRQPPPEQRQPPPEHHQQRPQLPPMLPTRKHSLHYILSPAELARDAPDVPNVTSPTPSSPVYEPRHHFHHHSHYHLSNGRPTSRNGYAPRPRTSLTSLPKEALSLIALHVVLDSKGDAGRPSLLLPLLKACRTTHEALRFDNNPVLYNRLFRATFDLAALVRRTQWMFDHKTDVPGTSRKTELFANPRSWATEYRDRWRLRRRMRICIEHGTVNVPGVSGPNSIETDLWALWFLWTENDYKNLKFLTEECLFHKWILLNYKDDMLTPSLRQGYPKDTAGKSLGIWLSLLSGADLFAERTAAEVDEKIYILRPYVFACFKYEILYAPWHHKRLPLCAEGCTEHPPIAGYVAPYKRFGHAHMRAPPHFVLGAYLVFLRLLDRQPHRIGLKASGNTSFEGEARVFSATHIMPSLYHDTEWQRNTVCQDPHTSTGLPPLAFLGRLKGFWRGKLLFYDFDAYRQMLAGNMRAVYTGTFAQHAVELDIHETVIRIREEEIGGPGSILNAGYEGDMTEEEQDFIRSGAGHEVLTGDAIFAPEKKGWTKEILLSGGCRSAWGWSQVRGRIRAWDGLVTMGLSNATPLPMGQWIWRGYIHTGGYFVGRWRDTYTAETQYGYEGPLTLVRAGDLFYPPDMPTSMGASAGVSALEYDQEHSPPGPAPGGVNVAAPKSLPLVRMGSRPGSRASSTSEEDGRKRRRDEEDGRWGKRSNGREERR